MCITAVASKIWFKIQHIPTQEKLHLGIPPMTRSKVMRARGLVLLWLFVWAEVLEGRRCFLQLVESRRALRNIAFPSSRTKMCGMHPVAKCRSLILAGSVPSSIPPALWWLDLLIWCLLCWRFGSWTSAVVSSVVCIGLTATSTELGPKCFAPFATAGAFAAFVCMAVSLFCRYFILGKHVGALFYAAPLYEEFFKFFGAAISFSLFSPSFWMDEMERGNLASFNLTPRAAMIGGFCVGTGFQVIENREKWNMWSYVARNRCNYPFLRTLDWDFVDTWHYTWHWLNSTERWAWISTVFLPLHACYTGIAARAFAVSPRAIVTAVLLHFVHNLLSRLCTSGRAAFILLMFVDLCTTVFFLCLLKETGRPGG